MIMAERLTTARLELRRPTADDLPEYIAYCGSPRSVFVRGPFNAAEAFDKFAAITGHWVLRGFGRYIITLNGCPIGHAGPIQSDPECTPEMTWTLWDGAHEGKGYATEAVSRVKDHCLNEIGWPELLIRIQPENSRSVAVAERIGAALTDKSAPDWYPGSRTYLLRAEAMAWA